MANLLLVEDDASVRQIVMLQLSLVGYDVRAAEDAGQARCMMEEKTPDLAILDETDSGLDVDAVRTVSKGIEEFQKNQQGSLLVITHSTRILESLHVDKTHIMVGGRIVKTGGAALVEEINRDGFERYLGQ